MKCATLCLRKKLQIVAFHEKMLTLGSCPAYYKVSECISECHYFLKQLLQEDSLRHRSAYHKRTATINLSSGAAKFKPVSYSTPYSQIILSTQLQISKIAESAQVLWRCTRWPLNFDSRDHVAGESVVIRYFHETSGWRRSQDSRMGGGTSTFSTQKS